MTDQTGPSRPTDDDQLELFTRHFFRPDRLRLSALDEDGLLRADVEPLVFWTPAEPPLSEDDEREDLFATVASVYGAERNLVDPDFASGLATGCFTGTPSVARTDVVVAVPIPPEPVPMSINPIAEGPFAVELWAAMPGTETVAVVEYPRLDSPAVEIVAGPDLPDGWMVVRLHTRVLLPARADRFAEGTHWQVRIDDGPLPEPSRRTAMGPSAS